MVLAPFTTLFPLDGVGGDGNGFLSDRTNFLSHSLQQLDRIDSLSEQVGFLEERIGACKHVFAWMKTTRRLYNTSSKRIFVMSSLGACQENEQIT